MRSALFCFLDRAVPYCGGLLAGTLLVIGFDRPQDFELPDFRQLLLIASGMAVTYTLAADAAIDHAIGPYRVFWTLFVGRLSVRQTRDGTAGCLGTPSTRGGGAWLGWPALPGILMIAGVAGLIFAIVAQNWTWLRPLIVLLRSGLIWR